MQGVSAKNALHELEESFGKGDEDSFIFDDNMDDELAAEMDKFESSLEVQSLESREQAQRNNDELLEMLDKKVGGSVTDADAEEALKMLLEDDESSSATNYDSDESDASSIVMSEIESDNEGKHNLRRKYAESESEGNAADTEGEDQNPQLKPFTIKMDQRVDQMDDAQIDRLCNLNNLDKRKCVSVINTARRKKHKRIRLLSTSSSSSSSSANSYGSTTPELVIDTQRAPTPSDVGTADDLAALADELAAKLDEDDDMSSLGSDTEIDEDSSCSSSKEEKRAKDKKKVKVEETPKPAAKPEQKNGSLCDDIRLWTSDDSDSDDDAFEVIVNDPLNNNEEKSPQPSVADVTTIISDSDSTDDDVTFVDEVQNDAANGRGRRNIRAILSDNELSELTQRAKNEEDARILRLEERSKTVESIQSQREEFVLDVDVKTGEPVITVDYALAQMLKPHQKAGVQFMWDACYESVEVLQKKSSGSGCILAHCMGLGKTLQVITLVHTLFTHAVTKTKHVLIICPLSTVINWKNEIKKAFSKLSQVPSICYRFIVNGDINKKLTAIREWRESGGILVMGYESFQIITNSKISVRVSAKDVEFITEALIKPGPDLIVCDEGHQLKNGKTLKTKAVMKVQTKRRIVLTGTPLQNNLEEYYWMVHFVKPHILGTLQEYNNRFTIPIKNGQYQDSRPEDIKLMKKRTHVLIKLLKMTIHRVESSTLSSYLPKLTDYTILIKLSPLQVQLYTKYINMARTKITKALFFYDCMILGICNLHPYALLLYYAKPKPKLKKRKREEDDIPNEVEPDDTGAHVEGRDCQDWYKDVFPDDAATNVDHSSKLRAILDVIDEIIRNGEKVLIFGKHLVELDLLEHFLKTKGTTHMRCMRPSIDYLRMDGQTPVEERDTLCKKFNNNATVKIFLLTHRVGGLGLNLTGANRVIMIGSNHNPSLDTQSMYRVYRFGQQKECYVYRMLSLGTMEEKIYHRCVVKLHLSGTVVDKLHFGRPFNNDDLQGMYRIDFDECNKDRPIPVVPTDKLLALLLQNTGDIYRYYPHNSLLENRPEEELTDEDKKLAWDEFNNLQEAAKVAAPVHPPAFPIRVVPMHQLINQRNNTSNLVPNPMNNNTRGFIPRALLQHNGMRPPLVPPNAVVNPFLNLFQQNTSGYNQRRVLNSNVVQTAREVLQNFERLRTAIPASERLQNFATSINDRSREVGPSEGPPTGEFNYALNKVV